MRRSLGVLGNLLICMHGISRSIDDPERDKDHRNPFFRLPSICRSAENQSLTVEEFRRTDVLIPRLSLCFDASIAVSKERKSVLLN